MLTDASTTTRPAVERAVGGFKCLSNGLAELRRMRIARDFQGQGYGTVILEELERRAVEAGIRRLTLETARRRRLTSLIHDIVNDPRQYPIPGGRSNNSRGPKWGAGRRCSGGVRNQTGCWVLSGGWSGVF
jgi:GNAT superfamily N-acetyltransferase